MSGYAGVELVVVQALSSSEELLERVRTATDLERSGLETLSEGLATMSPDIIESVSVRLADTLPVVPIWYLEGKELPFLVLRGENAVERAQHKLANLKRCVYVSRSVRRGFLDATDLDRLTPGEVSMRLTESVAMTFDRDPSGMRCALENMLRLNGEHVGPVLSAMICGFAQDLGIGDRRVARDWVEGQIVGARPAYSLALTRTTCS